MKRCVVLTGAGISAESGIATFRDADGLWEGHDVMEVATPNGWRKNPQLVLDFYNARRRQLHTVQPNAAHLAVAQLQNHMEVTVITQNVDNLHEKAGSNQVLHLHGELMKARSTADESVVIPWEQDLTIGDTCPAGHQLRPHIVWFGEAVPLITDAAALCARADLAIIIGTSMQVYPAAGLTAHMPAHCQIVYVDRRPSLNYELQQAKNLQVIQGLASQEVPTLINCIIQH